VIAIGGQRLGRAADSSSMRSPRVLPVLAVVVAACGDNHPADQPPLVVDLQLATAEDTPIDLPSMVDDPDGTPQALTYGAPAHGTFRATATGRAYVPTPDYHGVDRFAVSATDGFATATAVVTITIAPVNDPPRATADAFATDEDTPLMVAPATLAANDEDVDSPTLTVVAVGPGVGGDAALDAGAIRFAPARDFVGAASFTYTVSDGEATATATVDVAVGGQNDPPVGGADLLDGVEDTPLAIPLTTLLANDTDAEGQTLAVEALADVVGGTASLDRDQVLFTPDPDRTGDVGFAYMVTDGADSARATVAIRLAAVDDAPIATAGDVATAEDTAATVTLGGVDVDSTDLTVAIVTGPSHGTATLAGAVVTYRPAANFHGVDQLTFTVRDGTSTSAPATLAIAVSAVIECGDGEVEGGEACDDGNAIDTDGCRTTCVAAGCGDGVVWAGHEACDDGNAIDTDGCRTSCVAAGCGDGVVWAGHEACDDGNAVDTDACRTSCVAATCGDGVVEAGVEACDDGNAVDTDGCTRTCAVARCGDGIAWAGHEMCDDGNATDTDGCTNACAVAACGDGIVWAGHEACDDGNASDTDACLMSCIVAACGDGLVQAGVEACDDGNTVDTDACTNACATARCGDGVVQVGVEACDDGNAVDTDACRTSCVAATCGDGVVQAGVEACDDGNAVDTDACRTSCVAATCGDGVVQAGVEACDDGNAVDTDACRTSCAVATCGDGVVQAGVEACDDGNAVDTDACRTSCAVATCGDGVVQAGVEACDDGNARRHRRVPDELRGGDLRRRRGAGGRRGVR
jgi:cysteine-rich repeat protein